MYLRRRFVLGAADWMAGNNGSLQNDKLLFDYTDAEWEFIWNTLLEDGAWAVPGIKDDKGNVMKEASRSIWIYLRLIIMKQSSICIPTL